MTTCGICWTLGIIALCVIGVAVGAARSTTQGKHSERELPQSLRDSSLREGAKRGEESPFEPTTLVFRRADAKIVECRAATDLRKGYMVGFSGMDKDEEWSRTLRYAKEELACVLAEQALAAGGIRFQLVNGELRAELRAIVGQEAAER